MAETSFDVIVCGGGTAGAIAAIAAGRLGAKTLVIEQFGSLGGTQSNGWVTPMMPNYLGTHKLSRGISLEVSDQQVALQPAGDFEHGDTWYDPAMLPLVLDRLASGAGVTCLYNATLTSARVSEGKVQSVDVMARGGKLTLSAKAFLDATGDAELSALIGAELMGGNESGEHQPMTLRFSLGNCNLQALRESESDILRINTPDYVECGYGEAKSGALGDRIQRAIQDGTLSEDDLGYFQFFSVNGRPGELALNAPRVAGLDPLDPWQMSKAYQIGREKIFRIWQFCRRHIRGLENCYVSSIAPLMGIRESRRVVGEYVLTGEDHQNFAKFEDAIARNRYPVDIHLKVGLDYRKYPPGEWHDIPYRSLVVKGFSNMWVAGRCASADFVAQSAIRIQPVCRAMGEAAGVAAALAAHNDWRSQDVPYTKLAPYLDLSVPEPQAV